MQGRNNYVIYLKEKILELIKENPNITYKEISIRLPIGEPTVKKYIEQMIAEGEIDDIILQKRTKKPKIKNTRKSTNMVEEILQQYNNPENKLTKREIAKKYGVAYSTVCYHIKKLKELRELNNEIKSENLKEKQEKSNEDDELEL